MKLEDYARIVNAVDEVRDVVGEDLAEIILSTMEASFNKVEEFCKQNISGYVENGKLVPIIKVEDDRLDFEIDLKINGQSVEDEKYAVELSKVLEEAYNDIGWEIEEDED